MMKNVLLFAFLLSVVASRGIAQPWNPFPANQLSNFVVAGDTGWTDVLPLKQDSVLGDTLYFNQYMASPEMGACGIAVANKMRESFPVPEMPYGLPRKVTRAGDSLIYTNGGQFIFWPTAAVGQSWVVNAWGLTATCTQIVLDTVAGIADSVKVFVFTPAAGSPYWFAPGGGEFRLSKNHGLLEIMPFHVLAGTPGSVVSTLTLIGLTDSTGAHGVEMPNLYDSFALQPGDLLLFRETDYVQSLMPGAYSQSGWRQDSVIGVTKTNGQMEVTVSQRYFGKKYFWGASGPDSNVVNSYIPSAMVIYPEWYNKSILDVNYYKMHYEIGNFSIIKNLNRINLDESVVRSTIFNCSVFSYDPADCFVGLGADGACSTHTVDSRLGEIGYDFYQTGFGWERVLETALIGYRLGTETWGQTWGGLVSAAPEQSTVLRIAPNPASSEIFLGGVPAQPQVWAITAPDGRTVASGTTTDGRIAIEHLPAGLYVLRVGAQTGRFVKE